MMSTVSVILWDSCAKLIHASVLKHMQKAGFLMTWLKLLAVACQLKCIKILPKCFKMSHGMSKSNTGKPEV